MKKILLLSLLLWSCLSFSQSNNSKRADTFYQNGDYLTALNFYLLIDSNQISIETRKKIVNCCRLTNQLTKAESNLKIICASVTDSIYNQYYLNLLIRNQDFTTIENLIKSGKINLNLEELQSKIKSLSESKKQYRIYKVPINSANAEIGITKYKNGFIICSSRENNTTIERTHNWTKQPFLKLYYTENNQNTWSTPTLFANEIKCKYNKGPISFCNKEKEMWITENYVTSDNRSKENKYKLKICNYKLVDGKWIKQKDFPFNDRNFNVAHAAITEDGKTLYFSSDRPGGFGGMDLYYCTKTKKGWSAPINLGAEVNTWGNEVFPTLMEDGTIYFSSDGLIGIGGLDLFYTKNTNGIFLAPINIGAPINSEEDDFHLIFNSKTNKGYFSSNRINKGFDDDLFQFDRYESETKEESTREASTLEKSNNDLKDTSINVRHLIIINNETLEKMNGIKIFDSQNNPIEIESDNNDIQIDSSIKKIKIVKDGYYSKEIIFNEFKNQDTVKLKTNIGIAQADWYKIIYYDLDKSDLRKDMIDEVNDVVSFLQAHPELKITITSFTDSRASVTYNEKLSQRRTLMIEKYLLGHGIPKKQIAKSEWKGEGILVNNCGDLIPCTEEMHQLNRRTEVFISGLLK